MNINNYKEIIKSRLSDFRYQHSINVAKEAVRLAKKYGADEKKAEIAGVLHDANKEISIKKQFKLIDESGMKLSDLEKSENQLLHAISGFVYIKNVLKLSDDDILNSIRYHTTGRARMSVLEKVIFVADFTSNERNYDGVENMRRLADINLDLAMIGGLSFIITDLVSQRIPIAIDTVLAYNDIIRR